MKVNFSAPMLNLKGEVMKQDEHSDAPLTLADVAANALCAPLEDERGLDGATKAKRFKLALQIADGGVVDLKAEDIAEIKKVIGKGYSALIVGRAYEILDPTTGSA